MVVQYANSNENIPGTDNTHMVADHMHIRMVRTLPKKQNEIV